MSKDFIPYSRPNISEDEIEAVALALRNPMISQGQILVDLEKKLAGLCETDYAIGYSSGTAAIHGMYFAAGIEEGDEVIVPALTFVCTANALLYLGAKPVFVDIDKASFCVDPAKVEALITDKTKAIVSVDFAGHPSAYSGLQDIAKRYGLKFLVDAAHSPGGRYMDRASSSFCDALALSFNPVKNMTGGEGGAVLCHDAEMYQRANKFRLHGMTRNPDWLKYESPAAWYYEMHDLGFNYKLSELHAALARAQLEKLSGFNARRSEIARMYMDRLADLPLHLPHSTKGHTWHLFVVRVNEESGISRDDLFTQLRSKGIGVQLHYIPVPLHPYYRERAYSMKGLENTSKYFETAISIPDHPGMTDEDVERVVLEIRRCLRK